MSTWDELRTAALAATGHIVPVEASADAPAAPPVVVYAGDAKARGRARNGLRAYQRVYDKTLAVLPFEPAPLTGRALDAAAVKVEKSLDGMAPVPMEAHRPAQANPYPWMRGERAKPQRSRHAKRKGLR